MAIFTKYLLDENKVPYPVENIDEWAKGMEVLDTRIVKQEQQGDYFISTVFLGLDHNLEQGDPILFETMIFHHPKGEATNYEDLYVDRYTTYQESLEGHQKAIDHSLTLKSTPVKL